jgi:hypothetical protein
MEGTPRGRRRRDFETHGHFEAVMVCITRKILIEYFDEND